MYYIKQIHLVPCAEKESWFYNFYNYDNFAGMSDISPAKKMSMANSLRFLEDMREKTLNMLKSDR